MRPIRHVVTLCILVTSVALAQQYFPDHAFNDDGRLNDFIVHWYSKDLNALQEPSLWEISRISSSAQVHRFVWLRTFHHPVAVRIEIAKDGTGTLTAKMSSGAGGYEPGKLIEDRTQVVSKDDIHGLLAKLGSTNYWSLPSRDPNPSGHDGSQWVIEAVRDGEYKLIDRWSPKNGPARDIGLLVLHLSGLNISSKEIY